jgi:hypothetical protein
MGLAPRAITLSALLVLVPALAQMDGACSPTAPSRHAAAQGRVNASAKATRALFDSEDDIKKIETQYQDLVLAY